MIESILAIGVLILPLYVMIALGMRWVAGRVENYEILIAEIITWRRQDPTLLATRYEKIRNDIDPNGEDFCPVDRNNPPADINFRYTEITAAAAAYKRNILLHTVVRKLGGSITNSNSTNRLYDISQGNPVVAGLIDIVIGVMYG